MKNQDTKQRIRQLIPAYYHPILFFGTTNLIGLVAIYYSTKLIENVQALEWLAIPAVFLFANFFEYRIHRGPMHFRKPFADIVFKRHTLQHHAYFPHDQMGFSIGKEAYLVFFPFWAIFLVFAVASPIFFLTWFLTTANVAGLFLIVAIAYYLLYEWLHLCYHLPAHYSLNKVGLIKALRQHHQAHHNPSLMTKYNFNITFPIWDWILGTYYKANLTKPEQEKEG